MLIILVIQIPTASMSCNLIIQIPRPFGQWEYGNEKNVLFLRLLASFYQSSTGGVSRVFFLLYFMLFIMVCDWMIYGCMTEGPGTISGWLWCIGSIRLFFNVNTGIQIGIRFLFYLFLM